MEFTWLKQAADVGIALFAVAAFAYLTKYIIDKNKEVFDKVTDQLQENRKDYSEFVNANNHANSERIEKSTAAMVETANAIGQHTKVLERIADKLDKK